MSKGLSGPTWAILSPSNLPAASERTILGAIIPDYEHPVQNTIPDDASELIPKEWFAKPTKDENFKVAMTKATSQSARARLGDIVTLHFKKDKTNEHHLSSILVTTYALKQEVKAFKLLKEKYKAEISAIIDGVPDRNKGTVFHIVALKTCKDAEISTKGSEDKSKGGDFKPPIKEAITAAGHGIPPPINPDVELNLEDTEKSTRDASQVAKGERIFAVQYRFVRRRSVWRARPFKAKLPDDFEYGDYVVPKTEAMFAGDESVEEEEEEDGEEDPVELGSLEHTWGLVGTEADGIVMTRF